MGNNQEEALPPWILSGISHTAVTLTFTTDGDLFYLFWESQFERYWPGRCPGFRLTSAHLRPKAVWESETLKWTVRVVVLFCFFLAEWKKCFALHHSKKEKPMDADLLGRRGSEGGESAIWEINLVKNLSRVQLIAFYEKIKATPKKSKKQCHFF